MPVRGTLGCVPSPVPAISAALAAVPPGPRTRFAPAPTGYLHLGHLVNAVLVWGVARATGGTVVLRIEDHDRQRSRGTWETALLDDLERLGLVPDEPAMACFRTSTTPYRQSDVPQRYAAALAALRDRGLVHACDCARSTFAAWAARHGRPWSGPGCPGGCADRGVAERPDTGIRVVLGGGEEAWEDLLAGACRGPAAPGGDLLVRDRTGSWTYAFCVVVDDLEQRIDLVIRGMDLLDATPAQLRLAHLLAGTPHPARFLHHRLVMRPDGTKLSKADGATAVRDLLDGGTDRAVLLAEAARAAGIPDVPGRVEPADLGPLVGAAASRRSRHEPAPQA